MVGMIAVEKIDSTIHQIQYRNLEEVEHLEIQVHRRSEDLSKIACDGLVVFLWL
tara:strand:+ start:3685 stop:3846 length:162 start_codon:yes stop_codon:yes gene_type:complete